MYYRCELDFDLTLVPMEYPEREGTHVEQLAQTAFSARSATGAQLHSDGSGQDWGGRPIWDGSASATAHRFKDKAALPILSTRRST